MKYLLVLISALFMACSENPAEPTFDDSRCIHEFEALETLTILSDSTYAIGNKVYVAPPEVDGVWEYTRYNYMQRIAYLYQEGLSVKVAMTDSEIAEHTLTLGISDVDQMVSLITGYELPEPIAVTYNGIVCKE